MDLTPHLPAIDWTAAETAMPSPIIQSSLQETTFLVRGSWYAGRLALFLPVDVPLAEVQRAVDAGEVQFTAVGEAPGTVDVAVAPATWARWQQEYGGSNE